MDRRISSHFLWRVHWAWNKDWRICSPIMRRDVQISLFGSSRIDTIKIDQHELILFEHARNTSNLDAHSTSSCLVDCLGGVTSNTSMDIEGVVASDAVLIDVVVLV